jgi:hypothetical protein
VKLFPIGADSPAASVVTDDQGKFAFPLASSGSYQLRFEAPGFLIRRLPLPKEATEHDVDVGMVVLEIGEITEGPVVPEKGLKKAKSITVCEALANRENLSGKPVAIVGRIDCSRSLIDEVCFLAEDRCQQPVTTDGYAWPNKVLIIDYWEEGMPKPPATSPPVDQQILSKKLSLVRKSTTLGLHWEPRFRRVGDAITFSHYADAKDEWGIAYGLLFTPARLRKDNCGDEIGCGGFNGAPIALITNPHALQELGTDKNAAPKR